MNRPTPARRAASSTFKNPLTFTAFVARGSDSERGTDPSAAWCSTTSTSLQHARHRSGSRISPSWNVRRARRLDDKVDKTLSTFERRPVERLSRIRTFWSSRNKAETRCDPIKPAPPVTSHVLCRGIPKTGSEKSSNTKTPLLLPRRIERFAARHTPSANACESCVQPENGRLQPWKYRKNQRLRAYQITLKYMVSINKSRPISLYRIIKRYYCRIAEKIRYISIFGGALP